MGTNRTKVVPGRQSVWHESKVYERSYAQVVMSHTLMKPRQPLSRPLDRNEELVYGPSLDSCVEVCPNPNNVCWLKKCLVRYNEEACEVGTIIAAIMEQWSFVIAVRDMGHSQLLITFDEEEDCVASLQDSKDLLLNNFSKV